MLWSRPDTVKMLLPKMDWIQMLASALNSVNVINAVATVRSISDDFHASGKASSGMSNPLTKVLHVPPTSPLKAPTMSTSCGRRCPVHSLKTPTETAPVRLAETATGEMILRPGEATSQYGVISDSAMSELAIRVNVVQINELVDTIT